MWIFMQYEINHGPFQSSKQLSKVATAALLDDLKLSKIHILVSQRSTINRKLIER